MSIANKNVNYCRTASVICFWYFLSSSIILITKWALSGTGHFYHPLSLTTFSNTITTIWAFLLSRHPRFYPKPLTKEQFRNYVVPIGISTAMEIGFSNIALGLLTVSFQTMLKGGAPVFTMLWGLAFGVETFSWPLSVALLLISAGVGLASAGEGADFVVLGFILQLCATALGGFRWAITHVLLQGEEATRMPPLTATLYTSPAAALCLLPFAIALEGKGVLTYFEDTDARRALYLVLILMVIATFVFLLLISEYWLVHETSSLALSVAGICKELVTIAGGVIFYHDHISLLNVVGFLICQFGIGIYLYIRCRPPRSPQEDVEYETGYVMETLLNGVHEDDSDWDAELSPTIPVK